MHPSSWWHYYGSCHCDGTFSDVKWYRATWKRVPSTETCPRLLWDILQLNCLVLTIQSTWEFNLQHYSVLKTTSPKCLLLCIVGTWDLWRCERERDDYRRGKSRNIIFQQLAIPDGVELHEHFGRVDEWPRHSVKGLCYDPTRLADHWSRHVAATAWSRWDAKWFSEYNNAPFLYWWHAPVSFMNSKLFRVPQDLLYFDVDYHRP